MAKNIFTGQELYTEGWKKGNFIYIDGKQVDPRQLRENRNVYQFVREEDKNAVSRNIHFVTKSLQSKLWER